MAIRRVFTYLGAVFLMSHIIFSNNVGAVGLNYNLNDYDLIYSSNFPAQYCYYSPNTPSSTAGQCVLNRTNGLEFHGLVTENFPHNKSDLVEFYLGVSTPFTGNTEGNYGFYFYNYGTSVNDWRILNLEQVTSSDFSLNYGSEYINCTATQPPGYVCTSTYGLDGVNFSNLYRITAISLGSSNSPVGVVGTSSLPIGVCNTSTYSCRIRLFGVRQFRSSGSAVNKEVEDKTNESVQNSQTQGNSSQSDAQTGTASLVSTIGLAVSAITSASPTNCLLNGNMGNFDMGQIDLCANPVPAFVQIISSLILILITFPLCIVLFNRFIGLFRSFQG